MSSAVTHNPSPSPSRRREGDTRNRQAAEASGRRGERLAGWWLRLKGWRILDRRVRTPAGEVDLVARKGNLVAFIEVKTRATAAELDFAIDERRLARVAAAAEYLMPTYAQPGDDIRVDVILLAPGTRPRHIENAWQP
jgi:putative endonuclease